MFELTIALTIWGIADACFIVTSINRIRWMRLMNIHLWSDYLFASTWGWFGIAGCISLGLAIYTINTKGLPAEYTGLRAWDWIQLIVGVLFAFLLFVTSFVSLRSARLKTKEERIAAVELHIQMHRLRGY